MIWLAGLFFLLLLGTVGSMETGRIGIGAGVVRCIVWIAGGGMALLAAACWEAEAERDKGERK